jgi:hypothetical protein
MDDKQVNGKWPAPENDYHHLLPVNLHNARSVLVLGVLSIVFSIWYFALIGVFLSSRALFLASRDLKVYNSDKSQYSLSSYSNLKAGRACAIIGLSVSILFCLLFILILFGVFATWPFWGMID